MCNTLGHSVKAKTGNSFGRDIANTPGTMEWAGLVKKLLNWRRAFSD
jgi:hypothetical protein